MSIMTPVGEKLKEMKADVSKARNGQKMDVKPVLRDGVTLYLKPGKEHTENMLSLLYEIHTKGECVSPEENGIPCLSEYVGVPFDEGTGNSPSPREKGPHHMKVSQPSPCYNFGDTYIGPIFTGEEEEHTTMNYF